MEQLDISKATLDDIVFENRNKSYGAFLIRKLYDKHILIALGITFSVFVASIGTPVVISLIKGKNKTVIVEEPPKEHEIVDVVIEQPKTQPLMQEIPQIKIEQLKFVEVEAVKPEEADKQLPPPDLLRDTANISVKTEHGKDTMIDGLSDTPIGDPGGLIEDDDQFFFGRVDVDTEFPFGKQKMMEYINSRMSRRTREFIDELDHPITLTLTFAVQKDGSIDDVQVLKGKEIIGCKSCNDDFVEIFKNMPKWRPASSNGRPVRRRAIIPLKLGGQ